MIKHTGTTSEQAGIQGHKGTHNPSPVRDSLVVLFSWGRSKGAAAVLSGANVLMWMEWQDSSLNPLICTCP